MRSLSARSRNGSVTSKSVGSRSTSASRSVSSSVISERLLQPTESQLHSIWQRRDEREANTSSQSARGHVSADLIERLERKTASIVYNQWSGSEKEKQALLDLSRRRRMVASAERAAMLPNGGVPDRVLLETEVTEKLRRTKSPGRVKDKDPLDVGDGWYEKHHIPTEQEKRAGAHLQYHVGELTSRNYQSSPYFVSNRSGGDRKSSSSSRPTTPTNNPKEKENSRENSRSNTPVGQILPEEKRGKVESEKKMISLEPGRGSGMKTDKEEFETGFSR